MASDPAIAHHEPIQRRAVVFGAGAALAGLASAEQAIEAVYPRTHERPIEAYPFKLLKAALAASGREHTLRLSAALPSMRALLALKVGGVNVMDTGAAPRVADDARILPFPLDLGFSGYRLMLVHRDRLGRLQAVRRPEDLRELTFGQGPDWVDSLILRAAGLKVHEADFLSLFRMLEVGRFDAFPLGADEAGMLLELFGHLAPSVVLLEDWCLHYRFARVLAVRRDEPALGDALHDGLTRLYADGRARNILAQDARIGPLLDGRRRLPATIFELGNPFWTTPFQAIPDALFFKVR